MSETTSTSTSTSTSTAKTATLAALAIAQHAADHDLDYCGLDLPHRGDEQAITIRVCEPHLDDWLDTVTLDGSPEVRRPTEVSTGRELVIFRGTVPCPIGDVAVSIWSARNVVPLTLVGATS
jgi:hypothetical protein